MALNPTDLWGLDVPPLADIHGKALVEKRRLPPNLAEVPDRMMDGVRSGKLLFVLKIVPPPPPPRTYSQDFPPLTTFEPHADLYQFVNRGLARDERFKDYEIVSPDDRRSNEKERTESQYGAFAKNVIEIEENGGDHNALLKAAKAAEGKKGLILVLTPEVKRSIGGELGAKMYSKLTRLFPPGTVDIIDIQPGAENLYAMWEKYRLQASTEEFRRMLIEAMADPLKEEGVPERASSGFPAEFQVQPEQEKALRAIERAIQTQAWAATHLLIHGSFGVGKTTMLAGAYQLLRQTGFGGTYVRWNDNKDVDKLALLKDPYLVFQHGEHKVPDSVACIDQAEFGLWSTAKDPKKVLADTVRLMMTSNRPVSDFVIRREDPASQPRVRIYGQSEVPERSVLGWLLPEGAFNDQAGAKPPTTYRGFSGRVDIAGFTQRTHAVELRGQDWARVTSGATEW